MKKYRVNGSEHFNLISMREKMYVQRDDALDENEWDKVDFYEERIEEIESLLDKAPCVGSLVDWETLKRIREIQHERQFMRYSICLANGDNEREAAIAFTI